jgi:hypothetical protein
VRGHVALAAAILVPAQLPRDRAILSQSVDDVEGIDGKHRAITRYLHDDVELAGGVVQDSETHPGIVQPCGHVEIGHGRIQHAAGVVVEHDLTADDTTGQRKHHVGGTARHRPGAGDHAVSIHLSHEGNFPATSAGDLPGKVCPDTGGDSLAQVFSSFFFAAGKRTLFRISR